MTLDKRSLFGFVLIDIITWSGLANGHAYLEEPPSRNLVAHRDGKEYCTHCLQSGGPDGVIRRGNHIWPTVLDPSSHGLCGDPVQNTADPPSLEASPYLTPTAVQRTYQPGEVVEFKIYLSTHHRGHYEFRICDMALDGKSLKSAQEGQDCLNKRVLHRAEPDPSCGQGGSADCQPIDEKHPGRWYLPPKDETKAPNDGTKYHTMKYKIPTDLSCSHCTLQWYWASGNTCLYDEDYLGDAGYFVRNRDTFAKLGWDPADWCSNLGVCKTGGTFGEEFWNCADIAVAGPGGNPNPAPTPQPGPNDNPNPAPTPQPAPSGNPNPAPTPQPAPSGNPNSNPVPTPQPAPSGNPSPAPTPDTLVSEAKQQFAHVTAVLAAVIQTGIFLLLE